MARGRPIVVTGWGDPNEQLVESCHGPALTYRTWCAKEIERINATATERPASLESRRQDGWIRVVRQ